MRRLALISGILFTLTAGVWSSAAAARCMHVPDAPAASVDGHECCRAEFGESNKHYSDQSQSSPEAKRKEPIQAEPVAASPSEAMRCAGEQFRRGARAAAFSKRGSSCFECCAGCSGHTPMAVVAPELNKAQRDAGSDPTPVENLFAPVPANLSRLAPRQHAPPGTEQRRHILISVFLI